MNDDTEKTHAVPCGTCGLPTHMTGTNRCDRCWEVERRLADYLKTGDAAKAFVERSLTDSGPAGPPVTRLIESVRAWAHAECGATEADAVLAALARYDDAAHHVEPECENCGMVGVPLDEAGFCSGCVCTFCGAQGSMDCVNMCSDAIDSYAACVAEREACHFAIMAHGDQMYGVNPYVVHLRAVRQVLRDFGIGGDLGMAAWLHDVIEDTETSSNMIADRFGEHVAALAWSVTGEGKNRKTRNVSVYDKLRALPEAVPLKLADRIANVEASRASDPSKLAMYVREYSAFKEALLGSRVTTCPDVEIRMWTRLEEALFPSGRNGGDGS